MARVPFFPRSLLPVLYPIFENHYMRRLLDHLEGAEERAGPRKVVREFVFHSSHGAGGTTGLTCSEDVTTFDAGHPMKIIITGGRGFLGISPVLRVGAARARGCRVRHQALAFPRPALLGVWRSRTSSSTRMRTSASTSRPRSGRLFGEDDPMETITDNVGHDRARGAAVRHPRDPHGVRLHLRDLRGQRHRRLRRVRGAVLAAPQRVRDLQALRGDAVRALRSREPDDLAHLDALRPRAAGRQRAGLRSSTCSTRRCTRRRSPSTSGRSAPGVTSPDTVRAMRLTLTEARSRGCSTSAETTRRCP